MAEELVMDAPEASGESTPEIGAAESTESTAAESTEQLIDSGDSPQSGETGHLRGSELYRAVKDKLKASGMSTQELRSIRNAIHIAARADEVTGGDFDSFAAQREIYSQLAMEGEEASTPEQIVQTALDDRRQLAGILADLDSGAPKMLEELVTDRPDTFKSLAPGAMDKWADLDNDSYSSYIANATLRYLENGRIPLQFAIVDTFLPQIPAGPIRDQVAAAFEAIRKSFQGLEGLASKPFRAQNQPKPAATAPESDQTAQREMNITRQEWNRGTGKSNEQVYTSELSRLAVNRKIQLTESERSAIRSAVGEEFDARLAANRNYGQTMQAYLRAGNQKGYSDRALSEAKKLLPAIVSRHFDSEIAKRGAVRNGAKPAASRPAPAQTSNNGSGNLIQHLSAHPKTLGLEINRNMTTFAMLQKNQAILADGKRVQWPDKMKSRA